MKTTRLGTLADRVHVNLVRIYELLLQNSGDIRAIRIFLACGFGRRVYGASGREREKKERSGGL